MVESSSPSVQEIYREQYAHFRSMNETLYRLPPLFTVVIGGLWYFATTQRQHDQLTAVSVFLFAAVVCLSAVLIMQRFGIAFNSYIDNLNRLDGEYRVTIRSSRIPSTVKIIQGLFLIALLLSVGGSIHAATASAAPPEVANQGEVQSSSTD
jgi:hypothetical protein